MAHGVIHWEIGARDADRVKAFYAELFGWDITPAGPDYALVAPEGDGMGGGILHVREPTPAYLTFYVAVDDVATSLARSVALGATETVGPTAIPGIGRFAMFRDPEGRDIGILEPLRGDLAEAQGPSPGGSSPLSRVGGPDDDGSRPHDEESHPWEPKTRRSEPAG
ncbi:VOC family protein [Nocardioides daeguensis]|uniref:VOC domain-containing protein n=1 Tax=Nocardioides daeguensis TaxID=908359 RepID=A0ABP6UTG7_9ACTN|nr:VOC family protein [Nocardioides daeguensis]MBV6728359.1 VOC family protein [Nocardioides daeguensis]MCR1773168.1 VOC family protein [Nocardioides daeguensis]